MTYYFTDEKLSFIPLQPDADTILSSKEMQGVWVDVFSNNDYQEEPITDIDQRDKSLATNAVQVQAAFTKDAYMPSDPMTPENISSCPESMYYYDQDSLMPMTPIFSNLLERPTLPTVTHNNN